MADFSIRKLSSFNPDKDFITADDKGINAEKGGLGKRVRMIILSKEEKQKYDLKSIVQKINNLFDENKVDLKTLTPNDLKAIEENLEKLRNRYEKGKPDYRHKQALQQINRLINKIREVYEKLYGQGVIEVEKVEVKGEKFDPQEYFENIKYSTFGRAFEPTGWDKHLFAEEKDEFANAFKLKNPEQFLTRIQELASKCWVKRIEKDFTPSIMKEVLGSEQYKRVSEGKGTLQPFTINRLNLLCEKKQAEIRRNNENIIARLKKEYFEWIVEKAVEPFEESGLKRIAWDEIRNKCEDLLDQALGQSHKNEEELKWMEASLSRSIIENFLKKIFRMKDPKKIWSAVKQGEKALDETIFEQIITFVKDQIVEVKQRVVGKKLTNEEKEDQINQLFTTVRHSFKKEKADDIEKSVFDHFLKKAKEGDRTIQKLATFSIENIANQFIAAIEEYTKR